MTLIEAVVWVFVFAFTMATLIGTLLYFYRTNRYALQEALAIATTQRIIDNTVRVIRTTSYSQIGAYPIVSIAPNQFVFYASVTPGRALIDRVRFFVIGTTLKEGVIEPTGNPYSYDTNNETITFMVNNIQNIGMGTSTFHYFDSSGNEITNYNLIQNVRYVTMNTYIDMSTSTSPSPLLLTASAALRNLNNQ